MSLKGIDVDHSLEVNIVYLLSLFLKLYIEMFDDSVDKATDYIFLIQ